MMMSDREGNAFALVRIDDDFSKDPFASLPPSLSPLPLSLSISPLYFSLSLSLSAVSLLNDQSCEGGERDFSEKGSDCNPLCESGVSWPKSARRRMCSNCCLSPSFFLSPSLSPSPSLSLFPSPSVSLSLSFPPPLSLPPAVRLCIFALVQRGRTNLPFCRALS